MRKILLGLFVFSIFITGAFAQNFSMQMPLNSTTWDVTMDYPSGLTFLKDYSNTATLDANPAVDIYSYAGGSGTATFTRTNVACTYVDSAGVIQSVSSANVPRIASGYYDATGFHTIAKPGIMIESSRTNLFVNGKFDSNSNWADGIDGDTLKYSTASRWVSYVNGVALATTVNTISTDSCISGGRSVQIQITNDGTSITDIQFYNENMLTVSNATVYTASFWIKCNEAKTFTVEFLEGNEDYSNYGLNDTFDTVANTWIFISKTFTSDTGGDVTDGSFRLWLGNVGTCTVNIESLQFEAGPYPTSFIPTTTAALTRGAETLKYAIAENRTAAAETIAIKFMPLGGSFADDGVERQLLSSDTKNNRLYKSSGGNFVYVPNNTDSSGCNPFFNATSLVAVNTSYIISGIAYGESEATNAKILLDGTSKATNTTNYTAPVWGTYWYIGSTAAGATQGNILYQKVAIFNRALSADEVSAVTALMNQ